MLQAFWRAFSSLFGGGIQFKTTLKGASMLMNSTLRDLWMPGLMFFLMLASLIDGLVQLFRSEFSKCCPWLQLLTMTGMLHVCPAPPSLPEPCAARSSNVGWGY